MAATIRRDKAPDIHHDCNVITLFYPIIPKYSAPGLVGWILCTFVVAFDGPKRRLSSGDLRPDVTMTVAWVFFGALAGKGAFPSKHNSPMMPDPLWLRLLQEV